MFEKIHKNGLPGGWLGLTFAFIFATASFDYLFAQSEVPAISYLFRVTEGIKSPLRIAISDQDEVYVVDAIGGKICKFDADGRFLNEFRVGNAPLSLALTPDHLLFLGDRMSGELRLVDTSGRLLKRIAPTLTDLVLPSSAVIDDEGRIYLVDSKMHRINIFDRSGQYVTSFGDSLLIFPTSIALDAKNRRLFVGEHGGLNVTNGAGGGKMIYMFDKQGNQIQSFASYGSRKGQFTRIQGMAVDALGRIYVSDPFQGVVSVLSESGSFLTSVGGYGKSEGELRMPMDVAIDSKGRLWVSSMNNGSLEVYQIGDVTTPVADRERGLIPIESQLLPNYPNPFNHSTIIRFTVSKPAFVTLKIYDLLGREVSTLFEGHRQAGEYRAKWSPHNLPSGIYIYKLQAGEFEESQKLIFQK